MPDTTHNQELAAEIRALLVTVERDLAAAERHLRKVPPDLPGRSEVLAECAAARRHHAEMMRLARLLDPETAETECGCLVPDLVVRTDDGEVAVQPAATPGGLAQLYTARCRSCGGTYSRPFRVPPRAR